MKPQEDLPLFAATSLKYLSVSELNDLVKTTLEDNLENVWVTGEISNCRVPPSGHCYFTLKDDKSQISAVLFRRQSLNLKFTPENGMEVLCFGKVSLYTVRGDLQLYVESMEPRGQGALYLAFEQLKQRLAAEGLFDEARKRALPILPHAIGVVTSGKGAALHDMLRIIGDRYPDRRVVICPVKVQGDSAAEEIAAGITNLGRSGAVEVIIAGRGGGSLEDLWAFNEEIVARAIVQCPVPVISAVGHEIDFTIADFAADVRAPTPTAAAEMVVPRKSDLIAQVEMFEVNLKRSVALQLQLAKEAYERLVRRLTDPARKLREHQQRLDELTTDLLRRFHDRLRRWRDRLARESGRLEALSPLAVLQRGYSITHRLPEESIVKDATALGVGDRVRISFAQGKAVCRVEEKE